MQAVARSVARYVAPDAPPGLVASLKAMSVESALREHQRVDLTFPLLDWAVVQGGDMCPPHRVFNAAVRGLSFSRDERSRELTAAVIQRMKEEKVPISTYTLQQYCRTVRSTDGGPIVHLIEAMRSLGVRPNVACFNQLIASEASARRRSKPSGEGPPHSKSGFTMMLRALPVLGLTPNTKTLIEVPVLHAHECSVSII